MTTIPTCAQSSVAAHTAAPAPEQADMLALREAWDQARTCSIRRVPKAMARVVSRLIDRAQGVLSLGRNPATFRDIFVAEWIHSPSWAKGWPTLNTRLHAVDDLCRDRTPTHWPGEIDTPAAAARARTAAALRSGMRLPSFFPDEAGMSWWTDGAVFTQARALARTLRSRQHPHMDEDRRSTLRHTTAALRQWIMSRDDATFTGAPQCYLGRDWSDQPSRILVEGAGGVIAGYDAHAVTILIGCGATTFRLVDDTCIPRPDTRPRIKNHMRCYVLVGFAGTAPIGMIMPVSYDWAAVLRRWQAFGAKPVTSWMSLR